jgi:hypothetical protein
LDDIRVITEEAVRNRVADELEDKFNMILDVGDLVKLDHGGNDGQNGHT